MTARRLAARALLHLLLAIACLMALAIVIFRGLLCELADDVAASENENHINRLRGNTVPKNIKLTDIASIHRAHNARLAAVVGVNTSQARAELSDARQLAAELAMPVRRAS